MSKRSNNNRFVVANKNTDHPRYRKCAHHIYSQSYVSNIRQHDDIMNKSADRIAATDMDDTINIKVVFHFLSPKGSYNKDRVLNRAHDIIQSLNDDFNNYNDNPNTMNNFRYKSVINQVFISNMPKQNIYLSDDYVERLPTEPSNITFELGEIYYYPVKHRLNLSAYDDIRDVEIEQQVIKQYIFQNKAGAINPENFLNVWVIDMSDTDILSFSNFPWEVIDNYHGIVISRKVFFPEDYDDNNFSHYKTITHSVGHYLGLMHVYNQNGHTGDYSLVNINADTEASVVPDFSDHISLNIANDPTDKTTSKKLHFDNNYNPLFMNFMDGTYDKYVTIFTHNQLQKMRFMISVYRPKINSLLNRAKLPIPKYDPNTDTIMGITSKGSRSSKTPHMVSSYEPAANHNPRMAAQGYVVQPQTPYEIPYEIPPQGINPAYVSAQYPPPPPNFVPPNAVPAYSAPVPRPPIHTAPNLSVNNLAPSTAGNSHEQIIANIQNNMAPDSSGNSTINGYEDFMKSYQKYNSVNGYASNYPYDPYSTGEYNKLVVEWQKHQQEQLDYKNSQPIMTETENNPNNNYSQQQQQMNAYNMPAHQPAAVQPDPRMQQQMPSYQAAQPDPRMPAYQAAQPDPRMQQQQMPRMDPRFMRPDQRYPMPYHIPHYHQQQMQQMQQNSQNPDKKKDPSKRNKRVDPQFQNDNGAHDDNPINEEAVMNLTACRAYPKKVVNRPPPIMDHVPPHMAVPNTQVVSVDQTSNQPNLVDRITQLDEKIKNIKSALMPPTAVPPPPTTSQIVAKIQPPENKFNKFGQRINGRVAQTATSKVCFTPNFKAAAVPGTSKLADPKVPNKQSAVRTPRNHFTRSAPASRAAP